MGNGKQHDGLIMGIIFTMVSLILAMAAIGPFIGILIGVRVEHMVAGPLMQKGFYNHSGNLTAIFFAVILACIVIFSLIAIKKEVNKTGKFSRWKITGIFSLIYLVVHPLHFYIRWWGYDLAVHDSWGFYRDPYFDYTSFIFVLLGLLIDVIINKALSKRPLPL